MMEKSGSMGSLIAGFYLAEAEFKPDIYNFSLSFACDPEICEVCGNQRDATINTAQIRLLFQLLEEGRQGPASKPVLVAAAGNNKKRISMPASFSRVFSVKAFDEESMAQEDYSVYQSVPKDRFILAPGGRREPESAIAIRPDGSWDRKPTFFGTSFSIAFATGVAARYICSTKGIGGCTFGRTASAPEEYFELISEAFEKSAAKPWEDYQASRHGMGLLRYDLDIVHSLAIETRSPSKNI